MSEVPFDLITRDNAAETHLAILHRAAAGARIAQAGNADLERATNELTQTMNDIDPEAGYTLLETVIVVVLVVLAFFGVLYLAAHN